MYLSPGNLLWTLVFGWWIALTYLIVAVTFFGPLSLVGNLYVKTYGCVGQTRSQTYSSSVLSIHNLFLELAKLTEYMKLLLNLASYMFWPFGKFIAKHRGYHMLFQQVSDSPTVPQNATEGDVEAGRHSPTSGWTTNGSYYVEGAELEHLLSSNSLGNERSSRYTSSWWLPSGLRRIWAEGLSGMLFYAFALVILGPIHMIVSAICFFLVFPVPMAKLNYVLWRHLLRHPLHLSSHLSHEYNCRPAEQPAQPEQQQDVDAPVSPDGSISAARTRLPKLQTASTAVRPKSVFFWRPESMSLSPQQHPSDSENISSSSTQRFMSPTVNNDVISATSPRGNLPLIDSEYEIVLCTYHAMGLDYYKYTVDGINIIFINLLAMIAFTIFDFYVIGPSNGFTGIASKGVIFSCGILSVIPLAYFIGMAVSSITAHTGSVAIGSVINATFGSIIEIILYSFGLMEGKTELVEGAIIGSFLAGLLALPGVSMLSGGLKRKEQRFNAKSAGVTSTMLVVSIIGVFTPTIFQEIYGSVEIKCDDCHTMSNGIHSALYEMAKEGAKCRQCLIVRAPPERDAIYETSTRPLMYVCAIVLVLTYAVGLWFTLGTHASKIYPKKKPKRQSHNQRLAGLSPLSPASPLGPETTASSSTGATGRPGYMSGLRERRRQEGGSRPYSIATPNSILAQRSNTVQSSESFNQQHHALFLRSQRQSFHEELSSSDDEDEGEGGHDHPGWGSFKAAIVLLLCTVLYSIIAEVLIDSLDFVLEIFPLTEKTLGLTIFALVPTVTEFYNAIAFALNGNIALSLEIGSAYAIQVALLQIPALVAFSAIWGGYGSSHQPDPVANTTAVPFRHMHRLVSVLSTAAMESVSFGDIETTSSKGSRHEPEGFKLVFPTWDFYAVMLSVFLLTYIYIEGKSNYFKGAILLLSYSVLMTVFFYVPTDRQFTFT